MKTSDDTNCSDLSILDDAVMLATSDSLFGPADKQVGNYASLAK